MVLLGLMGGAKTDEPLDLSQLLYKRLRIEGESTGERQLSGNIFHPSLLNHLFLAHPIRVAPTGTTLRSRSLEYQSHLLQDFSKKALDKVFARCKGDQGLDLVIHKVRWCLLRWLYPLRTTDPFSSQVFDWKQATEAHEEMEQVRLPLHGLHVVAHQLT